MYRVTYRNCWVVEVYRDGLWMPVFYTADRHAADEFVRERT